MKRGIAPGVINTSIADIMESKKIENANVSHKAVVFSLSSKNDELAGEMPTEEEFAINISQIREIIQITQFTRIPGRNSYIVGTINLRGEIMVLFHLAHRLNYKLDITKAKIIIVEKDGSKIGLLVQNVKDVIDYRTEEIESIASNTTDFIKGLVKKDIVTEEEGHVSKKTRVVTILDTDSIITDEDMKFELVD